MKKVYLRAKAAPEVAGLNILRQSGPVFEAETDLFPRQLRRALDKAECKNVEILLFGKFVIDLRGIHTPHPSVFESREIRRALEALDPSLLKWLIRYTPKST